MQNSVSQLREIRSAKVIVGALPQFLLSTPPLSARD
jgi:hypothetical protein